MKNNQMRPVYANAAAVTEFPVPTTCQAFWWCLSMGGYYRNFCKTFSIILTLISLVSQRIHYVWTSKGKHKFDSVKAPLYDGPLLTAPDLPRPFKLDVDTSNAGLRAVLL